MIDAHAHLLSDKLNAQEIVQNLANDGLEFVINVGTSVTDSTAGIALANSETRVYTTVGIHPEYADSVTQQDLAEIKRLAQNHKVVAIGEIGLDYHYGASPKQIEKQQQVFVEQIKIASRLRLPVVIHCRDAADDILHILQENLPLLSAGFCMHCYSEGAKYIEKFLSLGAYISFTGNITYKKSDRSFLPNIDKDKIMVETDCPYLAPEPVRGTINQPKNVKYTAQKITDCLQMPLEKFLEMADQNTKRFFGIK